ncbi:MAG: putative electron transfer flavoprotein FixA [Clostridiales bacterium]|nr:putative electron transfer flavoprotein FixA [Clostridiales bacterium]
MKIVVCYKNVPDEQDIAVKADRTLDFSGAVWKIGQYDLNAIEAGTVLATATGDSEVIVLTAGGAVVDNSKQKKAVLSRGGARVIGVMDEALAATDTLTTATVLKAAIEKIGGVDLVLFGEGSGDLYAQQTGTVTGSLLGWPTVNAVQSMEHKGGVLAVTRNTGDGVELLEVSLPAVIAVTTDINVPRIPSMRDIIAAGKKPVEVWSLGDIGVTTQSATEVISILAPEAAERKQMVLEDDSAENIEVLYQHLRKLL